jgi:peptide/nickel transport system substrate-binding protein
MNKKFSAGICLVIILIVLLSSHFLSTPALSHPTIKHGVNIDFGKSYSWYLGVIENGGPMTQITYGLTAEPDNLNPFLTYMGESGEVYRSVIEGLTAFTPDGVLYPVLAAAVPTMANGGISQDGLTISYTLKSDIYWSDGELFTCDDVVFTYEVLTHPDSGAFDTSGYDQINSVTCVGDLLVIVQFNTFYLGYYELFDKVLPRHATGSPADMETWAFNTQPIGTGPFKMESWIPGVSIIVEKNTLYRDYPSKPLTDKIMYLFLDSLDDGIDRIHTGEIDILGRIPFFEIPDFEGDASIEIHTRSNNGVERLLLNLADPSLDATDDPLNNPHWALGQKEVRQAIQFGINKPAIINALFSGVNEIGSSDLNTGWAQCNIPTSAFSVTQAADLLSAAGWTDLDFDGTRECNGCPYANPDTPLQLTIQSTAGNQARLDTENMLVTMMAQIGIELIIDNVPSSELFGRWEDGAFRKHGNFDILMYTSSQDVDPHEFMYNYFHSSRMPTHLNGGEGWNYVRWVNAQADANIAAASITLDMEARKTAYQVVCEQIAEDLPHLYLYEHKNILLTRENIEGVQVHPRGYHTWNVEDWKRPCCEMNEDIGTSGGSLVSYFGDAVVSFPSGAFTDTVLFAFDTLTETMPSGGLVETDLSFELSGIFSDTGQTADLAPGQTFTFTVSYTETDFIPSIEDTLALYYWDGDQWVIEPTSQLDIGSKSITATPDHFSYWAVFGKMDRIFLPILFNDN